MASKSNSSHPPPQFNRSIGPSSVPKEEFSWLCTLIVTLSIILFLCLLTWFILSRDNDPLLDFTLHDFSVSNVQTLDSRLVVEWVAKFTIRVHEYDSNLGSTYLVSTKGLEGDQREVQDWVLGDIRKDRDNGIVIFGMQLVMWTPRYRRSYWARCSDLMVDFNQPKWVATLDWPRDCYVSKWNRTLHSLY